MSGSERGTSRSFVTNDSQDWLNDEESEKDDAESIRRGSRSAESVERQCEAERERTFDENPRNEVQAGSRLFP